MKTAVFNGKEYERPPCRCPEGREGDQAVVRLMERNIRGEKLVFFKCTSCGQESIEPAEKYHLEDMSPKEVKPV